MATYLKRTSKLFNDTLSRPFANVNLRDLMCPVCRGILIEPVTLPCTHNLCLRCLKGTFEHNSLSCPLCRVRVGSWLRTATKSETLVNNGLWELIRTRFAKEVEDKHNGDDGDIELSTGYTNTNKILSAAGEIRREYEIQLQMAEEEMRRQREAEQIASEELIRKIQAEEQEQLAQLAQDQLLAKTLAKKQVMEKQKETKHYECSNQPPENCATGASVCDIEFVALDGPTGSPRMNNLNSSGKKIMRKDYSQSRESSEVKKPNAALISKVRAERHASGLKTNASNASKDATIKFCCQKTMPMYNVITRTLKHQTVTKMTQPNTSHYSLETGCSTSKIYGTQSKEELHVPSDVLSSKKKSLGVEVCMTLVGDDERIGSAESAGSHDSINQEIHHFKPIKAMPRTPLKLSLDGKQIDPKLIRVIPVLKRACNIIPKPPSPTHLKRMIGCSWSAFKGKVKQDQKLRETLSKQEETEEKVDHKPSTSLAQPLTAPSKPTKSQVQDTSHRIELGHEVSIDSNKNYAKSANRAINGTKLSKRSILDESIDTGKIQKSWTSQHKNGMIGKRKWSKNWRKSASRAVNRRDEDDDDTRDSVSSSDSADAIRDTEDQRSCYEKESTVENIAERIKRRKEATTKKNSHGTTDESDDAAKRNTRKRILHPKTDAQASNLAHEDAEDSSLGQTDTNPEYIPSPKRRRACRRVRYTEDVDDEFEEDSSKPEVRKSRRTAKPKSSPPKGDRKREDLDIDKDKEKLKDKDKETREKDERDNSVVSSKFDCSPSRVCASEKDELEPETDDGSRPGERSGLSDEDVIKEQERIERLVLQEKEDFELARRLQAKFDEMERIAGRTRRSRRAIENAGIELDLYKVSASVQSECARTAKRTIAGRAASGAPKQRGRPRKRVK